MGKIIEIYKGIFYLYMRVTLPIYRLSPEASLNRAALFTSSMYSLMLGCDIFFLTSYVFHNPDILIYTTFGVWLLNFFTLYLSGEYKVEYNQVKYKSLSTYFCAVFLIFASLVLCFYYSEKK